MPVYRPPTRGTTIEVPFLTLVTRADPNFARENLRQIEYVFSDRAFYANPLRRGAYDGIEIHSFDAFQGAITLNAAAAPDGSFTASKFVEDATNNFHFLGATLTKAATALKYRWWVKVKSSTRGVYIGMDTFGGASYAEVGVDLRDGTLAFTNTGGTFTLLDYAIAPAENGYYSLLIVVETNTETNVEPYLGAFVPFDGAYSLAVQFYAGNGAANFLFADTLFSPYS